MSKRIAPGYYEVTTTNGTYDVLKGIDGRWYLTYPGERSADDVYATKADALAAISTHSEATR